MYNHLSVSSAPDALLKSIGNFIHLELFCALARFGSIDLNEFEEVMVNHLAAIPTDIKQGLKSHGATEAVIQEAMEIIGLDRGMDTQSAAFKPEDWSKHKLAIWVGNCVRECAQDLLK